MITQGNNKKPDAAKLQEVLKPTAAGMEKIESLKDRRSKTVSAFTIFGQSSTLRRTESFCTHSPLI